MGCFVAGAGNAHVVRNGRHGRCRMRNSSNTDKDEKTSLLLDLASLSVVEKRVG